jgi:hypothetical protein
MKMSWLFLELLTWSGVARIRNENPINFGEHALRRKSEMFNHVHLRREIERFVRERQWVALEIAVATIYRPRSATISRNKLA